MANWIGLNQRKKAGISVVFFAKPFRGVVPSSVHRAGRQLPEGNARQFGIMHSIFSPAARAQDSSGRAERVVDATVG
jgi:hypothetical protein